MTPKLLGYILQGYFNDGNYIRLSERFDEYYYKTGFLDETFYTDFIKLLSRNERGSLYALNEVYYKMKKDPAIADGIWTRKLFQSFIKCSLQIKSKEAMHHISRDFSPFIDL